MFPGSFEYRCRITPTPVNDEWPILEDYSHLCETNTNNCPEGTYCGSPYEYDPEMPWDSYNEVE